MRDFYSSGTWSAAHINFEALRWTIVHQVPLWLRRIKSLREKVRPMRSVWLLFSFLSSLHSNGWDNLPQCPPWLFSSLPPRGFSDRNKLTCKLWYPDPNPFYFGCWYEEGRHPGVARASEGGPEAYFLSSSTSSDPGGLWWTYPAFPQIPWLGSAISPAMP